MKKIFLSLLLLCLFGTASAQKTEKHSAFEVTVTGNGPDLLLIPGATCGGEVWDATVEKYKTNFTCHVFTLAGYAGVPALAEAPMLPKIKDAILEYANDLQRPVVMGHSIGGFLALQMAAERPNAFSKVIVADALPFLAGANNPAMTEEVMKKMPVEPMLAQYEGMDTASFEAMQNQVIGSMIKNKEYHALALKWSVESDRKAMAYTMHEMMGTDLRDDIASIEAPVLVLGAWEKSYPFPKEKQHEIYAQQYAAVKNCKVVMADDARHFIMYDAPEWYFEQLDGFLSVGF